MTGDKSRLPTPTEAKLEEADRNANLHRYDRKRAKGGRVSALNLLNEILVANAKLYQGSAQDKRDAIVGQLIAIQKFLADQGFALPTLEPLMHPVTALVEREGNRLDPVFAERIGSGRPKRRLEDESRTGAIAAISEVWLDSLSGDDRTQDEKFAQLARKISGGWFGELSEAKIKSAREIVSQESSDHPAASWAALYRNELSSALEKFSYWGAIAIVVRNLNRIHPKI